MSAGISFVGAGPGAADLITVRGARRIGEADVVLWAPSVVDVGWVRENTRADAELLDLARSTEDHVTEVYRRAVRDKLKVVRLYPGDPATWGALRAQLDLCARIGLEAEVVAGVSAVSAAAVSAGVSLTEPDHADSVITVGQETSGMPDLAQIREFAQFGTTMAVSLPAARAGELAEALCAGGFDESTPVIAAYKVSWPDEIVVRTTVGELVATVKQHRLWRHTLFLVGGALRAGRPRTSAPGEPARRSEGGSRWYRGRSSWRSDLRRVAPEAPQPPAEGVKRTDDGPEPQPQDAQGTRPGPSPHEEPAPQAEDAKPRRVSVTAVAEPSKKAAAASTPTKSVTAQATTPAKATQKTRTRTTQAKTAQARSTQAKAAQKGAKQSQRRRAAG